MNTFTERLHEKIAVLVPEYHILSRTRKHQNHRKSRCVYGYDGFSGLGGGCSDLYPQRVQQEGVRGVYEHVYEVLILIERVRSLFNRFIQ